MKLKTTTISIIMALIMLVPVTAITSAQEEGNELQAASFENQPDSSQSQQTDKDNTPFVIIILILLGLWYYKNKNGGKQK